MPRKPLRARRPARGAKPAPQDRQRAESRAAATPGVVSSQSSTPWVTCVVMIVPDGCEVHIMGDGPRRTVAGPGIRSALGAAGETLAEDYYARRRQEDLK